MLDTCLSMGSHDNMTIILVCFSAAPTIDEVAVKQEEKWKQKINERVRGDASLHCLFLYFSLKSYIDYCLQKLFIAKRQCTIF